MPNPIELILDPLSLAFVAVFLGLLLVETIFSVKSLAEAPYWKTRGLIAALSYFYLSSYLPMLTDSALSEYQLFDLTSLHGLTQFTIGLLVFELILYTWHRLMHSNNFLWRVFHQMHHSAERLDGYGAFWMSPFDVIGFTLIGSLALVVVVGLSIEIVTAIMLITFFFAIFQHLNVSTPKWLGYLVQRPESHSVHHGVGQHRNNYADLPIFDMLFGTFRNPKQGVETGFYKGASLRVAEMLLFKDVSTAPTAFKQPTESKKTFTFAND